MPPVVGSRRFGGATVLALTACAAVLLADAASVRAEPPPWAPAHGYRAKHKHHGGPDVVYVPVPTAVERRAAPALPYGFGRGTCDRDLISSELLGNVLGGAAGAAIGSRFGGGKGKLAAVAGGTLLGALIGGAIGRGMDDADQACAITALDHLPDDQQIRWTSDRHDYALVPTRSYDQGGRYCRDYTTTALLGGQREEVRGTACRRSDGAWEIVN